MVLDLEVRGGWRCGFIWSWRGGFVWGRGGFTAQEVLFWDSSGFFPPDPLLLTPSGDIVMTMIFVFLLLERGSSVSSSLYEAPISLCPHSLPPAIPVSQLGQKSRCPGCYQEERLVVILCLLVVVSLVLGCTGLAVTLSKCEQEGDGAWGAAKPGVRGDAEPGVLGGLGLKMDSSS